VRAAEVLGSGGRKSLEVYLRHAAGGVSGIGVVVLIEA
jgi:hypothetical protein